MCFVGLPHWKVMVCSSTTVGLMRSMTSLLWRYWMDKWFLNTPQVKIRVNLFVQKVEINPGQIYGSTMQWVILIIQSMLWYKFCLCNIDFWSLCDLCTGESSTQVSPYLAGGVSDGNWHTVHIHYYNKVSKSSKEAVCILIWFYVFRM